MRASGLSHPQCSRSYGAGEDPGWGFSKRRNPLGRGRGPLPGPHAAWPTPQSPGSPQNQSGCLTQTRADLNMQDARHPPSGGRASRAHGGDAQRPLALSRRWGVVMPGSPEDSTLPLPLPRSGCWGPSPRAPQDGAQRRLRRAARAPPDPHRPSASRLSHQGLALGTPAGRAAGAGAGWPLWPCPNRASGSTQPGRPGLSGG